jgi:hypothetical protein
MEPNDRERVVNEWLDAALKRYGEAEPRPGLESRILATLRAENLPEPRWAWRPALAGVALVVLLCAAVFLARWPGVVHETAVGTAIKKEAQATPEIPPAPVLAHAPSHAVKRSLAQRAHARPVKPPAVTAEIAPRLEQFPSAQPLSEQEMMLASYVRDWPEEAKLVARARTELLEQTLLELEKRNHVPEHSQEFEQ